MISRTCSLHGIDRKFNKFRLAEREDGTEKIENLINFDWQNVYVGRNRTKILELMIRRTCSWDGRDRKFKRL